MASHSPLNSETDVCPRCGELNSVSHLACDACGSRLPWADKAARPRVVVIPAGAFAPPVATPPVIAGGVTGGNVLGNSAVAPVVANPDLSADSQPPAPPHVPHYRPLPEVALDPWYTALSSWAWGIILALAVLGVLCWGTYILFIRPFTAAGRTYAWNIPFLLKKCKTESSLQFYIGEPDGTIDPSPTNELSKAGNFYKKKGKVLIVTSNGEITSFFIKADTPSGATSDKQHLLDIGNLKEDDPAYQINFVQSKNDPHVFTGVRITPKEQH